MVKRMVMGAEAAQKAIRSAASLPGADVALARTVIAADRLLARHTGRAPTAGKSALGSVQEKVATVLLDANRGGALKLLDRLEIDAIDDPAALEQLAVRCTKLKEYSAALQMRHRAAALDPGNPLRWVALARAQQRNSWGAVVHDPVAGLEHGPTTDTAAARDSLAAAHRTAPAHPYVLHERGKLEFTHGDWPTGLDLMQQAAQLEPHAQWWTDLAAAYRKPHVADLDRSLEAYERALQLRPSSPTAFRGLLLMGCRADQDWARLWCNAQRFEAARTRRGRHSRLQLMKQLQPMFTAGATEADISAALVRLNVATVKGLRLSWPTTSLLIYRLHFAQRMTPGFALRRSQAERTIAWLGTSSAGHSRHRQKLLAALVYLERYGEAQRLIDPMPWEPSSAPERHRLQKMAADVHLIQGRTGPLVDYARARAQDLPLPQEESFRRLIAGKRVAVVGPADTGDRLGAQIDSYDIIIRPRLQTEISDDDAARLGSRTDISYFSGRDFTDFLPLAREAVATSGLQMVVGRGLSMAGFTEDQPEWLRFYRHDFSLGFHGPPMGIGRILYDVLQFEPAEIGLFNIDFFTGQTAFGPGYREDKDSGLGPYSIVNEIILAHDLVFEHRLTKAIAASGVLTDYGVAGQVLALNEADYLQALEESPALRTRRGSQAPSPSP